MINGRSTESRSTLSVCILLDAPNPATPRSTVAPARPLPRNRSSNASYNGLPWYLSLSPMKTRISVRWPRNCSVIGTSQEFVAERRAQHHGADAAHNRRAHVECRSHVVAIIEECDALVAERTHGRERAAEPDGQGRANVGRNQRRAGGHTDDEAEQERTRDVDGDGSEWKTARGVALDPSLEAVARECAGDAAERDIQDCQKKTPAMNGSGRSHQPGTRRLKANSIACLETNYDGRRR